MSFKALSIKPILGILQAHELPKLYIPVRTKYYNNRHRDPQYRTERARKVWKVELPDFRKIREQTDNLTPDEIRSKLKEKGVSPPTMWNEREMYSPCTQAIIDPYQPPENEKSTSLMDKLRSPLATGKSLFKDKREESTIRSFEGDDFDLKEFAKQSIDIYIKAHQALAERNQESIFNYVTEYCFPLMTAGIKRHTIMWNYLDEVEPCRVVQVRGGDLLSKGNKYSQITTRMHTKQILAIFDRHGRLVHGSPHQVKEVLEYVIFEKYLANEYGTWRIHAKITQANV